MFLKAQWKLKQNWKKNGILSESFGQDCNKFRVKTNQKLNLYYLPRKVLLKWKFYGAENRISMAKGKAIFTWNNFIT